MGIAGDRRKGAAGGNFVHQTLVPLRPADGESSQRGSEVFGAHQSLFKPFRRYVTALDDRFSVGSGTCGRFRGDALSREDGLRLRHRLTAAGTMDRDAAAVLPRKRLQG